MKKTLGALVVAASLVGFCAAQSAKPNFAGTWKLNLQKSDYGQMAQMAPTTETDTITQTADEFKIEDASENSFGKRDMTYSAKLDGTDTPNPTDPNSPFQILSSKAEWQGATLVITQTTSYQDAKGSLKTSFTLSDDGKTLTKTMHAVFDQGTFDSKAVYDKA